eukprot:gene28739-37984_t
MFLVQSMDGKIQIFEQSANAFSRQLLDCLIPGPVSYVPKLDAFVTVNHSTQAECYRYQILHGFFSTSPESFQRPTPGSGGELLMICDQSLFLLKAESGGLIQQKRLERSDASCACAYPLSIDGSVERTHNIILATQDKMIQIYSAFNLVWAAKTYSVPVQLAVADFCGQKGLIVSIDDSGTLSIHYLDVFYLWVPRYEASCASDDRSYPRTQLRQD